MDILHALTPSFFLMYVARKNWGWPPSPLNCTLFVHKITFVEILMKGKSVKDIPVLNGFRANMLHNPGQK